MQIELNVQPLKLFIKQTCNKFFKAKTVPSVHPLKQLHCKQLFTFRTASFILEQDRKEPGEIPPVNPIPVSYTHLDVYKRQNCIILIISLLFSFLTVVGID